MLMKNYTNEVSTVKMQLVSVLEQALAVYDRETPS